jgi:predicted alpha/beta hydrolase family esterase
MTPEPAARGRSVKSRFTLGLAGAACLAALAVARPAHAQIAEDVVVAAAQGYTIAALVSRLQDAKAFKHGIALFPGSPGIMRLREEDGRPQFELGGNFLVRARRHWLDEETLVVTVDAPSDHWPEFDQWVRERPRYGADVARLLGEVSRRFPVAEWTFVGTSEGSVSAFHAARMNPALAQRAILTASVFRPGKRGPGLSAVAWSELKSKLLWVHHENDPCDYTPYREARRLAEKTGAPLVTVRGGGPASGPPCMARTQHGFVGAERATVLAMRAWVKTGAAPSEVRP